MFEPPYFTLQGASPLGNSGGSGGGGGGSSGQLKESVDLTVVHDIEEIQLRQLPLVRGVGESRLLRCRRTAEDCGDPMFLGPRRPTRFIVAAGAVVDLIWPAYRIGELLISGLSVDRG